MFPKTIQDMLGKPKSVENENNSNFPKRFKYILNGNDNNKYTGHIDFKNNRLKKISYLVSTKKSRNVKIGTVWKGDDRIKCI